MPTRSQKIMMMGAKNIPWYLPTGILPSQVIGAYQVTGKNTLAVTYINEAHPGTNNLTPGADPCLGRVGWFMNGIDHVLGTGIIITNTYSAFVQFTNCLTTGYLIGEYSLGTNGFCIGPVRGAPGIRYFWGGDATNVGINLVSGNVGLVGTYGGVNNHYGGFRNGVNELDAATGGWAGGVPTDVFALGARAVGGPDNPTQAIIKAFAIFSVSLTAAQALQLATAMAAKTTITGTVHYYSAIGTSITHNLTVGSNNYFQQLVLATSNCQGYNHSLSGGTIVGAGAVDMAAQVAAAASDTAAKIYVEMGTNDSASDPATVRTTYSTQLQALHASNASAVIYAMAPFPRTVDIPANIRTAIANGAADALAAGAPVTYVDTSTWINPATDTIDGLHPNVAGYTKILAQVQAL